MPKKRRPEDTFEFHQIDIQDEGGWCAGISSHLASLVMDCEDQSPEAAFTAVNDECDEITRNKHDEQQQRDLRRLQRRKDNSCFGVVNESGSWVYNFTGSGVALLNLLVSSSTRSWGYGAWFQWRGTPSCFASMNHAGLAVWDRKKMFIFDPNVGGSLWSMSGISLLSLFRYSGPALIDEALEYMYSNDSTARNRNRRAVVRSAAFVKAERRTTTRSKISLV